MDRASFAELVEATKSAHPLWFDLPSDAKADAEALRQVQRRLGIQLPDDYAWFLSEYGGGRFTFAEIYSADDRSDLHLVDVQPVDGGADILAFSDNGCGDLYVFPVEAGVAADVVWFHDHETEERARDESDGFLDWVARHALRPNAEC
jgi:hypothetical protein